MEPTGIPETDKGKNKSMRIYIIVKAFNYPDDLDYIRDYLRTTGNKINKAIK